MFGPTAPELWDDLSPPKKLDSGQSCLDIEFLSINYRGLNFPNFPIELGGATATAAAALTAQRADGGAETHIGADQEAATAGAMQGRPSGPRLLIGL